MHVYVHIFKYLKISQNLKLDYQYMNSSNIIPENLLPLVNLNKVLEGNWIWYNVYVI